MSQSSLPSDWVNKFTDPFAVLGIAVTADDRRVQKRYRSIAMRLHPDRYVEADEATRELTGGLLARLVNPAYEKLQQEQGRKDYLALLRLKVRRLRKEGPMNPKSLIARKLMEHPASNVDVFYEQAIAELAETQYTPLGNFEKCTEQISELHLVYLQLKMGDVGVHEKRTGLVAANEARPIQFTPSPVNLEVATESYDQRHYRRAQEYAKKGAWPQAIQEMREALKIKADKSEYHSLLGVAYLQQKKFPGMAKVHLKRALELNPQDPLAMKWAPRAGLVVPAAPPRPSNGKSSQNGSANHGNGKGATKPVQEKGWFRFFWQQPATKKAHSNGSSSKESKPQRGGLFGLFRSGR